MAGFMSSLARRSVILTQIRTRSIAVAAQKAPEISKDEPIKPFDAMPGPGLGVFKGIYFVLRMLFSGKHKKPVEFGWETREKYGRIWRQQFGKFVIVNISDIKDIEKVCRNEGKYPQRTPFVPWVLARRELNEAMGVLLSEGADWHRNRAALSKRMLRPQQVATYADSINDVITDMLSKIERTRKSANDNDLVPDIENILFSWSLDMASAIILNKKMGLLDDDPHPEAQRFIQSVHEVFDTTVMLFAFPAEYQQKLKTRMWKKHVSAWSNIFNTAQKLIDARMNEVTKLGEDQIQETGVDFLTYMIGQGTLSPSEIYADATELLMAAVDTTSNAFLWTLYNVAKHPKVQEAIYEEVNQVVPNGKIPGNDDINKLPYLKAVLKETTRLFPPIVNIGRILEKDIVVGGYNVPAGVALNMVTWMVARDPEYFDDPLEFKP